MQEIRFVSLSCLLLGMFLLVPTPTSAQFPDTPPIGAVPKRVESNFKTADLYAWTESTAGGQYIFAQMVPLNGPIYLDKASFELYDWGDGDPPGPGFSFLVISVLDENNMEFSGNVDSSKTLQIIPEDYIYGFDYMLLFRPLHGIPYAGTGVIVFDPTSSVSIVPYSGIWKATDDSATMFLQTYATKFCIIIIAFPDGLVEGYLDGDCTDGIMANDVYGSRDTLTLSLNSSSDGIVKIDYAKWPDIEKAFQLKFKAQALPSEVQDSYFPISGLYTLIGRSVIMYVQKYETGSVILVVSTGDGHLTAFIDNDYRDGITANGVFNNGFLLNMDRTYADNACSIDCQIPNGFLQKKLSCWYSGN